MRIVSNAILPGMLGLRFFAVCAAGTGEDVDPTVVETWELHMPGPAAGALWIWEIHIFAANN
ncbi:MAG TPA: hypothetical protein PKK23_08685 [Nitrospirales bacterium]|nr:hypothetical protein [Nitrospirales bacterium]